LQCGIQTRRATERELRIMLWDEVRLLEDWARVYGDPPVFKIRANDIRELLNRGEV